MAIWRVRSLTYSDEIERYFVSCRMIFDVCRKMGRKCLLVLSRSLKMHSKTRCGMRELHLKVEFRTFHKHATGGLAFTCLLALACSINTHLQYVRGAIS